MTEPSHQAYFDCDANALTVQRLSIVDPAVVRECRFWSQGRRGPAVELSDLGEADLSAFAVQALSIGATAMSAAAGVQETYGIESLVAEVERRSTQAVTRAADRTERAVAEASTNLLRASEEVKKTVVDAGVTARMSFSESVSTAGKDLGTQIAALLGGEQPQLLLQLQPLLDGFSRSLQERTVAQTSALIEKVTQQFNPADPASPMAQHMRAISETQARNAAEGAVQQRGIGEKLEALTAGLTAAKATELALARTAVKGATYEEQLHALLAEIASGLGDEYCATGNVVGLSTRSKKGDGLRSVPGTEARLAIEMTDSARTNWTSYLKEAEDNRGAQASSGLVRSGNQLAGGPILTLGPRRVVMAFDPETDDVFLLRCVIQLLRMAAVSAAARVETGEVAIADERIATALQTLDRIGKIRKSAGQIKVSATTVETEAEGLQTELARLLNQARTALAGAGVDVTVHDDVA